MSNIYPPVFKGKGQGLVPKVGTQTGKHLSDDGTWVSVRQKVLDLFFVGGQSNAVGQGSSGSSPTPDSDLAYLYTAAGITTVTDPVGGDGDSDAADTGSAWPQFAVDYNELSGRPVGLAVYAVDGSAQAADADAGSGNWDASGSIYAAALAYYQAAVTAFEAAGWLVNVRGILWAQGEADAVGIDDGDIVAQDYQDALEAMLVRFRTTFGDQFTMYMVRTGTRTGVSDSYSLEIRQKQEEVSRADPRVIIATRETVDFTNTSMLADTVHYNQAGLNLVGTRLAQAATGNVHQPRAGEIYGHAAIAGDPGEFIGSGVLAASAVSLTTDTSTNITSITLTPGDWDVEGMITFQPASATATTLRASLNTSSASLNTTNYLNAYGSPQWTTASSVAASLTIPRQRHNITATTTIYLVANPTFSTGTMTAYGQVTARRVR